MSNDTVLKEMLEIELAIDEFKLRAGIISMNEVRVEKGQGIYGALLGNQITTRPEEVGCIGYDKL